MRDTVNMVLSQHLLVADAHRAIREERAERISESDDDDSSLVDNSSNQGGSKDDDSESSSLSPRIPRRGC